METALKAYKLWIDALKHSVLPREPLVDVMPLTQFCLSLFTAKSTDCITKTKHATEWSHARHHAYQRIPLISLKIKLNIPDDTNTE
jgi:hypothetical protein